MEAQKIGRNQESVQARASQIDIMFDVPADLMDLDLILMPNKLHSYVRIRLREGDGSNTVTTGYGDSESATTWATPLEMCNMVLMDPHPLKGTKKCC
jgi:hypothetical protein